MAKRQNLKPPGQCIFCGNGGLSKQHIWPEWMKGINPTSGAAHSYLRSRRKYSLGIPNTLDSVRSRRQGPAGSRKIRKVCEPCNSGWMGQLETANKALLSALMRGETYSIPVSAQPGLAAWIALITIMAEYIDDESAAIPAEDRTYLMEQRRPPNHWRIWLARYKGANWDDHVLRRTGFQIASSQDEALGPPNAQVTTLVLGKFCAHIFSSTVWPDFDGHSRRLPRLWPSPGFNLVWPIVPALSDEDVVKLAEALPAALRPNIE